MSATEQLLEELAALTRRIEEHETAIWLLTQQRTDLRAQLLASGWVPPDPGSRLAQRSGAA